MARCPLCDRAFQRGVLCPVWWPHYEVCRRPSCRAAAEDALDAVETAREEYDDLASQIEQRHTDSPQGPLPVGWRSDAMVRMDHEDEEWGAIAAAKLGHRGDA
jgi:hypothetical protein